MGRLKRLVIFFTIIGVIIFIQPSFAKGNDEFKETISQLLGPGKEEPKQAEGKLVKVGKLAIPALSIAFDEADMRGKLRIFDVLNKMKIAESQKEILNILKKTCEQPLSGETWGGIPEEEFLKRRCSFAIKEFGSTALPVLKEELKSIDGEFKKRIIITTGLLDDRQHLDVILELLQKEPDPWIRELAAFALGEIGDKRAIPLLKKALEDEFYYELYKPDKGADIVFRPGDPRGKFYPVRQAAHDSLRKLGVKVKLLGGFKYLIEN